MNRVKETYKQTNKQKNPMLADIDFDLLLDVTRSVLFSAHLKKQTSFLRTMLVTTFLKIY